MADPASLPITTLKGVGPSVAQKLARLGLHTVQDVLFHLPLRYEDRTRIVPIGSLRPGDSAVIEGEVELTQVRFGKRRSLLSVISDGTGTLTLRFFHFSKAQQQSLARGTRIRCFGEVRKGPSSFEIVHPEYKCISDDNVLPVEDHLTPVYPATEGVHQQRLRSLSEQALLYLDDLQELLPGDVLEKLGLPELKSAIQLLHRPSPDISLQSFADGKHPAQQRLVFEELLAQHLSMRRIKQLAKKHAAVPLNAQGALLTRFLDSLPFELTGAQQRVVEEIGHDLQQPHPMQRLVQGDVGSGKTAVAACAMLQAVEAGYQVALMAPTELLAEQHYRNFVGWLEALDVELEWLSGSLKGRPRAAAMQRLASGEASVVVGTHALFQDEVVFDRLALIVIDEQHRFGVHQRLALREKGNGRVPHQLVMTATPIPRTLAMTFYADLDCSVIDELPPGRTPIQTVVIPDSRRDEVVQRVAEACREGRQAYWVCTLIEESDVLQCEAAETTAAQLAEALPGLKVRLVHGRQKPAEKEATMLTFKAGEIDLLVATTVIEVGVDVPNASLMVMENAERLGLSQLHQLRGRVGRGSAESSCVLMYRSPLSERARTRLSVMRDTNDGFEIARQDLELRGPGEVLGTRQTGDMVMRIADLLRDQHWLPAVEQLAGNLLEQNEACVQALIKRWIGQATRYADV
jgi:ATP-dependent DNA helicase RecG